ncbi:General secretory system II protein E domain protein [Vulgatibacter incomptus]|uniref:General secretory system II protein E domain protein n=1 Tax=Vulgatibacter incomptus TaxID=1391653 RepID=A0A0K1P8B6_9BACT|nr:General secretory system II protein E domain protein [Vulgatibacter incomptus]
MAPDAAEEALQRQILLGGALDTSLLELDSIDEETLGVYLSRASGLPLAPPEALSSPPESLRRVLPLRLAERYGVVPFDQEDRTLHMACSHPVEATHLDEMAFLLSQRIVAYVAPEFRVRIAMEQLFGHPAAPRFHELAQRLGASTRERPAAASPSSSTDLSRSEVPDWTKDEALSRVAAAADRDDAIEVLLRFTRRFFDFTSAFVVQGNRALGWDALGSDPGAAARIEQLVLSLEVPSVLQLVSRKGGRFLGPLSEEEGDRELLSGIGRPSPRSVLVQPISIAKRTVALLYAENGPEEVAPARVEQVTQVAQAVGAALERMILARKHAMGEAGGAGLGVTPGPISAPNLMASRQTTPGPISAPIPVARSATTPGPIGAPIPGAATPGPSLAPIAMTATPGPSLASNPMPPTSVAPNSRPVATPGPELRREGTLSFGTPGPAAIASAAGIEPARVAAIRSGTLDVGIPLQTACRAVERYLVARGDAELSDALDELRPVATLASEVLVALLPGQPAQAADRAPGFHRVTRALEALGSLALPALKIAAGSSAPGTRHQVAHLLRACNDDAAHPILAVLAGDEDPGVSAAARGLAASSA